MRAPGTQFCKAAAAKAAFTLLEMLVSMSVLALLLVLVTQLVNSASMVTTQSTKRLDADNQARMLFDRMGTDFARIIQRTDIDTLVDTQNGNDRIFFFSEAVAYYNSNINRTDKSSVALIGYRVTDQNGDPDNFAPACSLERFGKGLTWDGAPDPADPLKPGGMVFTPSISTITSQPNVIATTWQTDITYTTGGNKYYHVLTDQVFRMQICFQVKDTASASGVAYSNYPVASKSGVTAASASAPSSAQAGDRWYNTNTNRAFIYNAGAWQPNGLKDVLSVVVTIAVLDNKSRQMSSGNLSSLQTLFPKSTLTGASPKLPAQVWKTALETALMTPAASFSSTYGIPKAAGSQIRIYQRHFPLTTFSK